MSSLINPNVLWAVFKRNFVSYFSDPRGYLFICVFVWLSVMAAFWPDEFFNTNLANLDQLNKWFPWIMLVFIPAITMAIWAEERRLGTDELLLTIPATDWDIVLGKYLAAVAIYSVSLGFSMLCTYTVLESLGDPDVGLFIGTYFGYWLVGLAMLAVGMVASFLTAHETVAYILGALFNGILVILGTVPVLSAILRSPQWAVELQRWGIGGQLADFARGVISLAGIVYFLSIVVLMLYICMVVIGRRHWRLGPVVGSVAGFYLLLYVATGLICLLLGFGLSYLMPSFSAWLVAAIVYLGIHITLLYLWPRLPFSITELPGHYITRILSVAWMAVGLFLLFQAHNLRLDVTSERINSLSPETVRLVRELKVDRPIVIEAFISPASEVPESYVQTRLNVLHHLYELAALGKEKIRLIINETSQYSDEAARAEQRYKIQAKEVRSIDRGTLRTDNIFLGVAFTCGLEKVVVPFIDRGIPVEYELVRSLAIVAGEKRKKVGVIDTDAGLRGNFLAGVQQWPIIDELEKQYEVKPIDLNSPLQPGEVDVLLAVQPSTLTPDQMKHFLEAVRSGIPTAIFEDPCPRFAPWVPATSEPRRPPSSPFMMFPRDLPKGDIQELWNLLGIDFSRDQIIWQDYNPYPKIDLFREQKQFVFLGPGCGAEEPFYAQNPITQGLQNMLLPFPGAIFKWRTSDLEFLGLLRTGPRTGTVRYSELFRFNPFTGSRQLNPAARMIPTNEQYVLAARIRGKLKPEASGTQTPPPTGSGSLGPSGLWLASVLPAQLSEPQAGSATVGSQAETKPPTGEKTPPSAESKSVPTQPAIQEASASEPVSKQEPPSETAGSKSEPGRKEEKPSAEEKPAPAQKPPSQPSAPSPPEKPKAQEVNVVVVADIDMLTPTFFALREQGEIEELGITFDFDNVTFVLNVLDELAGETRFFELRKRRPKHRTLTRIEEATRQAREETAKIREEAYKKAEKVRDEEQRKLDEQVEQLRKRTDMPELEKAIQLVMLERSGQRRLDAKVKEAEAERDREIKRIETQLATQIRRVQDAYKMWAVVLPPIPPLVVAIVVFFIRRAQEHVGVAKSRLRG
ncbi:MAG: Gldg family protein [Thermoguttaceae bacterium]|nr:Gldg family protein [Thermoguttaceae bacterium]MDW8039572.1 Gldg family protein [Thermoguttaceae bacterium]